MKSERLLRAIGNINGDLVSEAEKREKSKKSVKQINPYKWGLVAACLALFMVIGIPMHFLWGGGEAGAFTLDVNPGIEYTVTKNGMIQDVKFINSEARDALAGVGLVGRTVEKAVEKTLEAYKRAGYLQDGAGAVLITYDNRIGGNAELRNEITEIIRKTVARADAVQTLMFHNESDSDKAREIASELGISRGKADCILAASNKTSMTYAELAKIPLPKLLAMQDSSDEGTIQAKYIGLEKAKKIALNDVGVMTKVKFTTEQLFNVGTLTPYYLLVFHNDTAEWTYKIDALQGKILEKHKKETGSIEMITLEMAKEIALKDAKLDDDAQKIVFTREQLMRNQGKPCYELEFYTGENQYFYRIDAKSGSINYAGKFILMDEAKRLAVEDSGALNKVIFTVEELVSGGIKTPYYRFVFHNNNTEWTYKIDAVLGTVLEKQENKIGPTDPMNLEKAKEIAIAHADIEGQKVIFTKAKLNPYETPPCYELEFYTGEYSYVYEIDAADGSVLYARRYILLETARQIALGDVVILSRVTFTVERLVDGGIKTPYYLLVFDDGYTRWTYKIDAVLGIILDKKAEKIKFDSVITLEKAKEIALKDAGLNNADIIVTFTKELLVTEGSFPYYELEFYTYKYRHSYQIDARDGAVISKTRYLTVESARSIAMDDAGVNDAVFINEVFVDGGIKTPYYILEFTDGRTVWKYKIDAVLGIILEKSKASIGAVEFISLEQAKKIALADAGLSDLSLSVVFTKEALYRNQGQPCYILEFYSGKTEYSYKIDAVTGVIIEKLIGPDYGDV